ncbi:hypothetical protein BTUL_0257g00080 [Botrytis tulipae]|uniref:Uncharacterized protein n=1 Tax=Botrytis tulipae TaxID=87230 RepID=A0A4Z1EEE8_9HELO|nr:hypothetical protein BTUL_0257g00080 [Botrytis tulipae]
MDMNILVALFELEYVYHSLNTPVPPSNFFSPPDPTIFIDFPAPNSLVYQILESLVDHENFMPHLMGYGISSCIALNHILLIAYEHSHRSAFSHGLCRVASISTVRSAWNYDQYSSRKFEVLPGG